MQEEKIHKLEYGIETQFPVNDNEAETGVIQVKHEDIMQVKTTVPLKYKQSGSSGHNEGGPLEAGKHNIQIFYGYHFIGFTSSEPTTITVTKFREEIEVGDEVFNIHREKIIMTVLSIKDGIATCKLKDKDKKEEHNVRDLRKNHKGGPSGIFIY